jgi:hypothetical protein
VGETKVCSKCKEEKSVEEFSKHCSKRDGRSSLCKLCSSLYAVEKGYQKKRTNWYQQGYNSYKEYREAQVVQKETKGSKVCSRCQEEKALSEFRRHSKNKDCWQSWCNCCHNIGNAQYRVANKEEINNHLREYYSRNGDRIREERKSSRDAVYGRIFNHFGGECYICGYQEPFYEVYDCHHINPADKVEIISKMIHLDWDTVLLPELKKCVYLCSNCHRKVTKGRFNAEIESGNLVLTLGKRGKKCI